MLVVALAGVFATYGRTANFVRLERQATVAQQNSNSRMDQLRTVGWASVTNPTYLSTLLTSPISATSNNINVTQEVITVYPAVIPQTSPLPSPTPSPSTASTTPYFTVTRTGTAAPVINPASFDPNTTLTQMQLTYCVSTQWTLSNKTHTREMSATLSRSATH
jgi:hypothetical protein